MRIRKSKIGRPRLPRLLLLFGRTAGVQQRRCSRKVQNAGGKTWLCVALALAEARPPREHTAPLPTITLLLLGGIGQGPCLQKAVPRFCSTALAQRHELNRHHVQPLPPIGRVNDFPALANAPALGNKTPTVFNAVEIIGMSRSGWPNFPSKVP